MNSTVASKTGKLMHSKRFANILLYNLNKQRCDKTLCDVDFIVGPQKKHISAHRCIMAAASPYFTAMFTSHFNESKQREVPIKDVEPDDFELLVEFCYSSTIHINNDNSRRILQAAHCFQFPDVIAACSQYLKSQLDSSTCLGILHLAEYLDLKDLMSSAMNFMCRNFIKVSKSSEFLSLDIDTVSNVLKRNDLVVNTEEDVFRAMLAWIQYDNEEREKFTEILLKLIRLTHLNLALTIDDLRKLSTTSESKNLLINALIGQLVPERRREVENFGICTKARKYIDNGKIIAIGNRVFLTDKTAIEIYCGVEKKWTVVKTFNKRYNSAATIMNNKLVIAGGQNGIGEVLNSVLMYDLKSFELDKLPPMIERRHTFQLCFMNGFLYAIAGWGTKTIERFCFQENVWHYVKPLNSFRRYFSTAVLNNQLFVIGGKTANEAGTVVNRVDAFIPQKNKWIQKGDMVCNRNKPAITAINGNLYAYNMNSLERYDADTDSWNIEPVTPFSRKYYYTFMCEKNLFFIGRCEEAEVNEDTIEIEEFEEIEEEEDDEYVEEYTINTPEISATTNSNEGSEAPIVGRNETSIVERNETVERLITPTERIERIPCEEPFEEKFIKKLCIETGTITKLPLMNVIRNIEFFVQIPSTL